MLRMKRDLLKSVTPNEDRIDKIMKSNGTDIEVINSATGDVETIKQENDSPKA